MWYPQTPLICPSLLPPIALLCFRKEQLQTNRHLPKSVRSWVSNIARFLPLEQHQCEKNSMNSSWPWICLSGSCMAWMNVQDPTHWAPSHRVRMDGRLGAAVNPSRESSWRFSIQMRMEKERWVRSYQPSEMVVDWHPKIVRQYSYEVMHAYILGMSRGVRLWS